MENKYISKYRFVTGEVVKVELSGDIANEVRNIDRLEANAARRYRYHEVYLNAANDYSTWNAWVVSEIDEEIRCSFEKAMAELTDEQRDLIDALFGVNPMTEKQYAETLGISQQAVAKRLKKIRKIISKFF
ncbi:MAG: sigma factor-like helix-turn-helix DNA-binding protein [Bacillota bacterium]|nr:sigma factor-like helix-turn-helix DNA-binding protein [Bacillota bacterium]